MNVCHMRHDTSPRLFGEREALRLAQAQAGLISVKETAAASAMARMDQTSRDGLDVILQAGAIVVGHERGLEALQRKSFQRLYIMSLVTLLASALSLKLIRQSMRQWEAQRDAAMHINKIVNNVVYGIVTVDRSDPSAHIRIQRYHVRPAPAGDTGARHEKQPLDL